MNIFSKKHLIMAAGIISGIFFPGSQLLAQNYVPANQPGNPQIYRPTGAPVTSQRQGKFTSIQDIGMEIIRIIEQILVPLIMSLGLLVFLWGIVKYIQSGGEPAKRVEARQFMLWGIIGLAVMASVWALVRILTSTIGVPMGIPSLDPIR